MICRNNYRMDFITPKDRLKINPGPQSKCALFDKTMDIFKISHFVKNQFYDCLIFDRFANKMCK